MMSLYKERLFNIATEEEFRKTTLEAFAYQFANNKVYRDFVSLLGKGTGMVADTRDIPFMPVEFFRNHRIISGEGAVETIFESSSTTSSLPGKHYVTDAGALRNEFFEWIQTFLRRSVRLSYLRPAPFVYGKEGFIARLHGRTADRH